jgi:hypothetical protein
MRPALSRPIDRMARVQRPPIEANIGAETAPLDEPLRTIVAALAQALKRAKPKLVNVAAMWLDMIADRRRLDGAALRAILTQRMLEQLVPPDPGPTSRGIPLIPLRRLATSAHRTQPFQGLAGSPPVTRVALWPGYALLARRQALLAHSASGEDAQSHEESSTAETDRAIYSKTAMCWSRPISSRYRIWAEGSGAHPRAAGAGQRPGHALSCRRRSRGDRETDRVTLAPDRLAVPWGVTRSRLRARAI